MRFGRNTLELRMRDLQSLICSENIFSLPPLVFITQREPEIFEILKIEDVGELGV